MLTFRKTMIVGSFKKTLALNGFTHMNNSPIRIVKEYSTIINIIALNKDDINDTVTAPTSLSDHFMASCFSKLNNRKYLPKKIKCCDYSNYNEDILIQRLTTVDWSIIYNCENVDNYWELLNHILEKHFNGISPAIDKRIKGRPCQWLNDDVKKQMNACDKIYRKAIKSKKRRRLETI